MHQIWHLSEYCEGNLGLSCTKDGLLLGHTPLVEWRGAKFAVRERRDIERLLSRAYGIDLTAERLMAGLETVAAAMNNNDPCLMRIAAVHLRIPDLPNLIARERLEAEDILLKSTDRSLADQAFPSAFPISLSGSESSPAELINGFRKASPDDPEHPGWPAGTEDGLGGKFRPKDASEITRTVERIAARRMLRTRLLAGLRFGLEGLANIIPGVDVAADVLLVADIARTAIELRKLAVDAAAALDFVKQGPHNLEELEVPSNGYEQFSSYDQFYKDVSSLEFLTKRFGPAGDGQQYHHIITQGGRNADNINIPPEQLQNTDNIIRLPTLLHEAVSAEYSKKQPGTNMTKYQWLQTQPCDAQREEGLKILRELNIIK